MDGVTNLWLMPVAFIGVWATGWLVINRTVTSSVFLGAELVIGYSTITAILSLSFFTGLNVNIFFKIWLGLIVLHIPYILGGGKKYFNVLQLRVGLSCLFPLIFFGIVYIAYGDSFISFRGNIWDWFNYNTMAVTYSRYEYRDIELLLEQGNSLSAIAKLNLTQRPSVVALPASILSIMRTDSFNLLYMYKGLLLSIYFSGVIALARSLKFSYLFSILFSGFVVFSSWTFYVVEIDALAQLAFLPYIPFILIYLRHAKVKCNDNIDILAGFVIASGFIVYPEFGGVIFLSLFMLQFYVAITTKNLQLGRVIRFMGPVLALTLLNYNNSVKFLVNQFLTGFTATVDWWGYYGAYALGPYSPVTNPLTVHEVRESIAASGTVFNPYTMNLIVRNLPFVLPSVFGLFHVVSVECLLIPANLICLAVACKVLMWLSGSARDEDSQWLKILILILVVLLIVLVLRGNFWSAVKGFSYLMTVFPLALLYAYAETKSPFQRKIMNLFFFMVALFPIYKYSTYNNGIGHYDGFPSILHKSHKIDYQWSLSVDQLSSCDEVFVDVESPFKRHFVILILENFRIRYTVKHEIRESYGFGKTLKDQSVKMASDFPRQCVIFK